MVERREKLGRLAVKDVILLAVQASIWACILRDTWLLAMIRRETRSSSYICVENSGARSRMKRAGLGAMDTDNRAGGIMRWISILQKTKTAWFPVA